MNKKAATDEPSLNEALDIAEILQMTMSAIRLSPISETPEWGAALEHVESRLFVVARVAEACGLKIPSGQADPRSVLRSLVQRFGYAGTGKELFINPTVDLQPDLAMSPRSLLSLGMLVYELLDGLASIPAMRTRCTGLKLVKMPCERGARLDMNFEEQAGCFGYGPELFVALNYLATDLICALVDQLGATLIIGCEGHAENDGNSELVNGENLGRCSQEGSAREVLRIVGIGCA